MQRLMLSSLSVVLAGLLSACATDGDASVDDELRPTPTEDLPPVAAAVTLNGRVVQAGTEDGIEGIQVTFRSIRTTTDADGLFAITLEEPLAPGERHALTAADMDGPDHGGDYHSGSVRVVADEEGKLPDLPDDLWRIKLRKR